MKGRGNLLTIRTIEDRILTGALTSGGGAIRVLEVEEGE